MTELIRLIMRLQVDIPTLSIALLHLKGKCQTIIKLDVIRTKGSIQKYCC